MFTLIRTIGGGPKNRFKQDGYNLDLTYITPKIIAMSFPSIGFQSVYRNDLQEIVQFLHKRHNENYMIVNVSNRKYQYDKFHGQIKDYFWPNHQTPQLKTLFQICSDVTEFLSKSEKNVVAFHCNHGKGRTGTAIISYLLYSGYFTDLKTAIEQYNAKRFSHSFYQIDIPCQVRYLEYFESIIKNQKINFEKISPLRIIQIQTKGIDKDEKLFIRFSYVKDGKRIEDDIQVKKKITYLELKDFLIGDIKAQIFKDRVILGLTKIGYINFNTYFTDTIKQKIIMKQLGNQKQFCQNEKISFLPDEIKKQWGYSKLSLTFKFKYFSKQQFYNEKYFSQEVLKKLKTQQESFQFINKVMNEKKRRQNLEFRKQNN